MSKRLLFALIVLSVVMLQGCFNIELKTVVLEPSQVATATKRDWHKHEDAGYDCDAAADVSCYDTYGVSADAVGDAPIAVGLWHHYGEADASLVIKIIDAVCWERLNCIYRGLVLFDLTTLGPSPRVVTARLKYHQSGLDKHNDATKWSAQEDCIAKVGYLTSPWGGFDLPAEYYGSDVSLQGFSSGIDVSVWVRDWAEGKLPNHGFLFVGPKESVPHNDNDRCVATLDSLRLEVQLNVAGK